MAVSGGPDSLALLLLAQQAIPGKVEAATVDHGLRAESASEAVFVAGICAGQGIPHAVLRVELEPGNLQSRAREARYAALANWMAQRGLNALATAHHADDQAETLLMRLNRASGLAGLAGVRARGTVPGTKIPLLRPLLGWRRKELARVVEAAGIDAVQDPSNADPRFDRVRLRQALAGADWIDPAAFAASAAHLADAEEALDWAAHSEWEGQVTGGDGEVHYSPVAPFAIRLLIVKRIVSMLGSEPRGGDAARLVTTLERGEAANLGGVLARPEGDNWVFRPEPARRS